MRLRNPLPRSWQAGEDVKALIALSRELSEVRTDLRGLSVATQRDAEDIKVLKEGQKQLLESVHGLALQQGKIEGRLFHLEERVATGFKRVDERADERHTELKALLSGRRR